MNGSTLTLTPDADDEPQGLEVVRVRSITCSLTFFKNAEKNLMWPIDRVSAGMPMNYPYCRVYATEDSLSGSRPPDVTDIALELNHLYFDPLFDKDSNTPESQSRTFTDEAVRELARQMMRPEDAQSLIIRHHFEAYVRPHALSGPAYGVCGNSQAFSVISQLPPGPPTP